MKSESVRSLARAEETKGEKEMHLKNYMLSSKASKKVTSTQPSRLAPAEPIPSELDED